MNLINFKILFLASLSCVSCNDVGFNSNDKDRVEAADRTGYNQDGKGTQGGTDPNQLGPGQQPGIETSSLPSGNLDPISSSPDFKSSDPSLDVVGNKVGVGEPRIDRIEVDVQVLKEFSGSADLIFLVDSSSSMEEERAKLQQNIGSFLSQLDSSYGKLDFQVILVGKDFTFSSIKNIPSEIKNSEITGYNSLDYLSGFLVNPGLSKLSLRNGVKKEIIIVSDTNATMRSSVFLDYIKEKGLQNQIGINGIIGLPTSKQNDWCRIAGPGSAIIDLSKARITSGIVQDICSSDWNSLLKALADKIVKSNIKLQLALSKPIVEGGKLTVLLNQQPIDSANVSVDYNKSIVILSGVAEPQAGDEISVLYESQ